jgi:hypothetical protein
MFQLQAVRSWTFVHPLDQYLSGGGGGGFGRGGGGLGGGPGGFGIDMSIERERKHVFPAIHLCKSSRPFD